MGGGGGGADSGLPQIVFSLTSITGAAEPQNLVTFPKFNGQYDFEFKNDKLP